MGCTSSVIAGTGPAAVRAIIAGPIGTAGYSELTGYNGSTRQPQQTKLDAAGNQTAAGAGAGVSEVDRDTS